MPNGPLTRNRSQLRWGKVWGQSDWIQLAVCEWWKASCHSGIFFSAKGRRDRGLGNQQKKQTSHDSSRTPTRYSLEENLCLFLSPSRAGEAPHPGFLLLRLCALQIGGAVRNILFLFCAHGHWRLFFPSPLCRIYNEHYWQHFWYCSIKALFPVKSAWGDSVSCFKRVL